METKTIKVSIEFKDWLDSKGTKGETYEDILRRLIKFKKKKVKKK